MSDRKVTSRAVVLKDGNMITSRDVLRAVALKQESKQLATDVFATEAYDEAGLVQPLYSLEALAQLTEINTYHMRAVKTIARDTTGHGWNLALDEDANVPEKAVEEIEALFKRPHPTLTLEEILYRAVVDFESTGNLFIEVIRDGPVPDGDVRGFVHIPAHTMRVHKDGVRLAQKRGGRTAWFKRFGMSEVVDLGSGQIVGEGEAKSIPFERQANEVIHLMDYTSRSDYYGLPSIMPALAAIMLERERQEYMLDFFENHAVPAYAVTVVGAEVDEAFEDTIREYFQKEIREHRHSTLVLTIGGDGASAEAVEIKFERLAVEDKEASFRLMGQDCRDEVLSAHAVPPYRAGIAKEGALGGSVAVETTEIYNNSVVAPRQELLESRLTRLIETVYEVEGVRFDLGNLDTRDEKRDVDIAATLHDKGAASKNELREAAGYERIEDDPSFDEREGGTLRIDDNEPDEADDETVATLKRLHADLVAVVKRQREAA